MDGKKTYLRMTLDKGNSQYTIVRCFSVFSFHSARSNDELVDLTHSLCISLVDDWREMRREEKE